jgi:hypothetical protein
MTALLAGARAAASRLNGAKSRGPKTEAGKARSSQNALKHGLRAQCHVVLPDEDPAEYEAFAAALLADLAPHGALQALLASRVAAAAWRLLRADRIEVELFAQERYGDGDLGLALIRDCNGAGAFQMLLRYRGAAQAEFWRALRTLKALQAEAEAASRPAEEADLDAAPALVVEPERARAAAERAGDESACAPQPLRQPNGPENRGNPRSLPPGSMPPHLPLGALPMPAAGAHSIPLLPLGEEASQAHSPSGAMRVRLGK